MGATPWKGTEGSRTGRREKPRGPTTGCVRSTGIPGVNMAFEFVPRRVPEAGPLYPCLEYLLGVGCPGEGVSSGEAALRLRHSRRDRQVKPPH